MRIRSCLANTDSTGTNIEGKAVKEGGWKESGKKSQDTFLSPESNESERETRTRINDEKREGNRKKGKSLIEATSNRSASQLSKGVERVK